jgi:uncharacterized membrane protein
MRHREPVATAHATAKVRPRHLAGTGGPPTIGSVSGVNPESSPRWLTLDVFRGMAIISMIQGHVFTALLKPEAYDGGWVAWHTLVHGHTAPTFLVGAGIAYGFVTLREGGAEPGAFSRRIVKRAFTLLALGYLLQVPRATWAELMARPDLIEGTLRVGPLQLVGACLLGAELLRVVLGGGRGFVIGALGTAALIAGAAPFVWKWHVSQTYSVALGAWLDGYRTSMFPFFPWAAFFFIGSLLAVTALRARRHYAFGPTLFAIGGTLTFGCLMLYRHGVVLSWLYGEHDKWMTNPLFLLFRVGIVFGWLGILCGLEPLVARLFAALPTFARVFTKLSKQSLVAYVVHLLMLYGSPFTVGLVRIKQTLDVRQGTVVFALVMTATTVIALIWDRYVTSGALGRALSRSARRVFPGPALEVDGIREGQRLDAAPVD